MAPKLEDIEKQALLLPPEDRERLAERLLRSLDAQGLSEIDEAWIHEAERRYEDHLSGRTDGVPAKRVFADIRRRRKWPRWSRLSR